MSDRSKKEFPAHFEVSLAYLGPDLISFTEEQKEKFRAQQEKIEELKERLGVPKEERKFLTDDFEKAKEVAIVLDLIDQEIFPEDERRPIGRYVFVQQACPRCKIPMGHMPIVFFCCHLCGSPMISTRIAYETGNSPDPNKTIQDQVEYIKKTAKRIDYLQLCRELRKLKQLTFRLQEDEYLLIWDEIYTLFAERMESRYGGIPE